MSQLLIYKLVRNVEVRVKSCQYLQNHLPTEYLVLLYSNRLPVLQFLLTFGT